MDQYSNYSNSRFQGRKLINEDRSNVGKTKVKYLFLDTRDRLRFPLEVNVGASSSSSYGGKPESLGQRLDTCDKLWSLRSAEFQDALRCFSNVCYQNLTATVLIFQDST
ncbi:hypothetical protein M0804_006048 [Polistes exclamans]|nr:hypothetical protein M0804_006048 [Polistes exclamans]